MHIEYKCDDAIFMLVMFSKGDINVASRSVALFMHLARCF